MIPVAVVGVDDDDDDLWIDVVAITDKLLVCCCTIGDGLICVIIPLPSPTIPVIELLDNRCAVELFPFILLQFSFDIVIGCVPVDKHFESMGTETGEEKKLHNRIKTS